jgi:DNA anti-recombination protein RmuC
MLTLGTVQKLYKGESYQGEAKVIFGRVESVVNELIRFMGHLPKELWLEQDR